MTPSYRIAAGLALALLGASSAIAHSKLEMSEPTNGAELATAPSELKLQFNEPVEAAVSTVKLFGPGDKEVAVAKVRRDQDDAKRIVVDVPRLDAGAYRAQWATAGHDGHRVKGEISFSVK